MATLTKYLTIRYTQSGRDRTDMVPELQQQCALMIDAGKTDGVRWYKNSDGQWVSWDQAVFPCYVGPVFKWVDLAATEEWLAITQDIAIKYNHPIDSFQIEDV